MIHFELFYHMVHRSQFNPQTLFVYFRQRKKMYIYRYIPLSEKILNPPEIYTLIFKCKTSLNRRNSHLTVTASSCIHSYIKRKQYRKIPKINPAMFKPPKLGTQKNPPLNCPSKYKPPPLRGGACTWKLPSNTK